MLVDKAFKLLRKIKKNFNSGGTIRRTTSTSYHKDYKDYNKWKKDILDHDFKPMYLESRWPENPVDEFGEEIDINESAIKVEKDKQQKLRNKLTLSTEEYERLDKQYTNITSPSGTVGNEESGYIKQCIDSPEPVSGTISWSDIAEHNIIESIGCINIGTTTNLKYVLEGKQNNKIMFYINSDDELIIEAPHTTIIEKENLTSIKDCGRMYEYYGKKTVIQFDDDLPIGY